MGVPGGLGEDATASDITATATAFSALSVACVRLELGLRLESGLRLELGFGPRTALGRQRLEYASTRLG